MGFVHVASIMMFIIVLSHLPGYQPADLHQHCNTNTTHLHAGGSSSSNKYLHGRDYNTNTTTHQEPSHTARKLLFQGESSCTSKDLTISQSLQSAAGIPVYMVEIVNTCGSQSKCAPSDIHLHCGQFASAHLVNPLLFKRLTYDDCLVNNGHKLSTGQVISFSYSNTFKYPISFKHATFC